MQNWYAVLSILEHLLTYLKKCNSDLKEAYLQSDNAGCYHCAPLLHSLPGVNVTQLKGAIDSYGGILGTQACVVTPSLEAKDSRKVTWPGIGQFNNFEFSG